MRKVRRILPAGLALFLAGVGSLACDAVAKPLPRMDRTKLLVGAYCFRPCGDDEGQVKAIADCGIDFITGVDARHRSLLDLFAKYHVGIFAGGVIGRWWGGDGKRAGQMRSALPMAAYERELSDYLSRWDHPAVWKLDICDEPSAKDMPHLAEVSALIAKRVPQAGAYINLYPNYASVSTNTGADETNQLGTESYRAYVDTYCREVPLDYLSYDFYVYTPYKTLRERLLVQMYDNFNIASEACRRTKRSLWYVPQVNSYPAAAIEPTTENRLRFQAFTAMAYGAEVINWACWMAGWWTNNVCTADGKLTEQYGRLKTVNAEVHRLGAKYMAFRNTATHYVGFPADTGLAALNLPLRETLDADVVQGLATDEKTPLVVGEMVPRGKDMGLRALFVVASGDPFDEQPALRTVTFRLAERRALRILGSDGEIKPKRSENGLITFPLRENAAALVVIAPKKSAKK